ncbi:[Pyruvate dehydrogenase (acetyl-transferring)] kinase, mitochondrial [Halotydeus destructor]|nr:[Pyruvate dehydrogenase (acetyl-transferring)] kinase, mitochondrial [Halotydeus destructor]
MRLSKLLYKDIYKYVETYSRFNPSPLSIKQFIDFGRKECDKTSMRFLRKELPVRLANIMQEIQLLPDSLLRMPSVALVQSWYERSFEEIMTYEKSSCDNDQIVEAFTDNLVKIRNRHSSVVQTMAQGVIELKETHKIDQQTEHSIQYFLHRFYMNRISIRMLINQHVTLFGSDTPGHSRHIGCVDPNCDVTAVARDAYSNARFLCDQYYMNSPELVIEQYNVIHKNAPISFTYVPSHLYHILFELFKNAMRAVVEHHGPDSDNLPPLRLLLGLGNEDVSIKICDQGGGVPRSLSDHLFNYMYSTAPKPSVSGDDSAPLAGFGYGLPLSRLYARYLHGDLKICSYEGYGTDAIVYLKLLCEEANEMLPVFNKTSSKHYKTVVGSHDWSSGVGSSGSNGSLASKSFEPVGLQY